MPAKSKSQQRAAAIALHHPERLHKSNEGLKQLSMKELHAFAATKTKGLPKKKR